MGKLPKFRQGPRRFFEDARQPLVRVVGQPLGAWIEAQPLLMEALASPHDLLERWVERRWAAPIRVLLAREARERQRVLREAGWPEVAIVVPARNAEDTIEASLRSLLGQSYVALEIIVVDDASSDRTLEIASTLARGDARLKLLRNEHPLGAAGARNRGLRAVTAPFVTFHDADDHSAPQRIERQLAALLNSPRASVAICNYRRVDTQGRPMIVNGRHVAHSILSMLFRSELLQQKGYMPERVVGEDSGFFERLTNSDAARIVRVDQCLYVALFRPNSLLFSNGEVSVARGNEVTFRLDPKSGR